MGRGAASVLARARPAHCRSSAPSSSVRGAARRVRRLPRRFGGAATARGRSLQAHVDGDLADKPGNAALRQLGSTASLPLAPATAGPAAAPAALTSHPPLAPRENFAVRALLDPAAVVDLQHHRPLDAGLLLHRREPQRHHRRERAGLERLQSQDLADLITRAHAAGERVVLTVDRLRTGLPRRADFVAERAGAPCRPR